MTSIITVFLACCAGPASAEVAVSTPPATVAEAYRPRSLRDPLVVSIVYGDVKGRGDLKTKGEAVVAKSSFSVYNLRLTGIMEDSRGRQALLRDSDGKLYTLKAGRLTDSDNKLVRGVSGVVKGKQVTLMTEEKKIHHLSLREKE